MIQDKFQKPEAIEYYGKLYAKKLGLSVFSYYYDNQNKIQIPSSKHISTWKEFYNTPLWRLTFNLRFSKSNGQALSVEDYIREHHKLEFYLTIKGYSILYVLKFNNNNHEESYSNHVTNNNTQAIIPEEYHQMTIWDVI